MRIGCLQFSPQVGDVENNITRADAVLAAADPKDLDLLVLPEMAFSGYNFKSLQHIIPYLEPTTSGVTSAWARAAALRYRCVVMAGYPEKAEAESSPEYYNSAVIVSPEGKTLGNYRKSFLYYTDETWAQEGGGFFGGEIEGLGSTAMGICMDLNPYKFEAPWTAWEFAHHVLQEKAKLVVVSMAWSTREEAQVYTKESQAPDMDTLSYWIGRLQPLIQDDSEDEIIIVLANRAGTEEETVYTGTSSVLGVRAGEIKIYGVLGRGDGRLLVVDTDEEPEAELISRSDSGHTNG